jgi:hypothetical protein
VEGQDLDTLRRKLKLPAMMLTVNAVAQKTPHGSRKSKDLSNIFALPNE